MAFKFKGPNKYRAQRTEVDGHKFASRKEAKRYKELKLAERAQQLTDLRLQPRYMLRGPSGPLQADNGRVLYYVADFEYVDTRTGVVVIEDVKSPATKTPIYRLKKAIMANMGFTITEV